ncbi:MAG: DNA-directed RNA polymerase subunit beta [Coriobacteriales bacterium]|nr:DNA-directed RNA polymerase subunit beta [Coriobacteriales bacterium]
MELPNLIAVQKESFNRFMNEGLAEAFKEVSPIENTSKTLRLTFHEHEFGDPKYTVEECKAKDINYQAPLLTKVQFENLENGEISEQIVFMGDFPLMTERGTFIINGSERIVVSQLVRSPGVYYFREIDANKLVYRVQFIPTRGAWLEFETDKRGCIVVSIDRKRKQPASMFLRALGIAETDEEIIKMLGDSEMVQRTLARDTTTTRDEALVELYKRQRPGEPPTLDSAKALLDGLFFNQARYDLASVGRYKLNKKLGLDVPSDVFVLTPEDVVASLRYLICLHDGLEGYVVDERDHFGNRRVRTVGELIGNQFRIGLSRMERVVRERMASQEIDSITPQSLINIRPIVASIKEFFGSSQLSQFMDQNNPLAGLSHKRRLSALGPGGVAGHKTGSSRRTNVPTEARDIHNSHYSRMCPIETPEGPNIGLVGSIAIYARVNKFGFIEAPYRRVVDGKVTDEIDYMTADEEENHVIAQASELFDETTRKFISVDPITGEMHEATHVIARTKDFYGDFGTPADVPVSEVDYMDVSPRQMLSIAATLIPFLEHDDAKRTLMGANMQRQAVPLIRPAAPYVGTGMELRAAVDSGEIVRAKRSGIVDYADAKKIRVRTANGAIDTYNLLKFQRSNQSTCINHKPLVYTGQEVEEGDVLADGPSTDRAELALGQNLVVAYMPWEGYNYEDAIIVSERVVQQDLMTTINISKHEIDARDTKLGPEEITREIPNLSEDMVANLDSDGIIRIGAEVKAGDILVGKVTPKGESALTAEERLLRAIFGAKAHDVRDTSLKMPHGAYGRVIDVVRFSRERGDELAPGVNDLVRVYVAQRRKIQQGDKISGRHGNKGVISRILPVEDMPYMADGTPIDVILDPLGVPSRMNVGQLLECHLGWAASHGWNDGGDEYVPGPFYVSTPVFDGATEDEIADVIRRANKNLIARAHNLYGDKTIEALVPQLNEQGKIWLYDGRTGERFPNPITVGTSYILKLGHMVDDKIHARSTGPYSLVTQQPLGGKAQFGGQRFGEMEVWALYAYGASNVLQEILTVKSDDTQGRVKAYESIVKGDNIPMWGVPESFKVLVKEIRSLALDIEPIANKKPVSETAQAQKPEDETSLEDLESKVSAFAQDLSNIDAAALEDDFLDSLDIDSIDLDSLDDVIDTLADEDSNEE